MTSSIFATTVAACFFVVALPHVLSCPAPRVAYADGDTLVDENGRRLRRRTSQPVEVKDGMAQFDKSSDEAGKSLMESRGSRECPVPKPGGILGELLGFHKPKCPAPERNTNRCTDEKT